MADEERIASSIRGYHVYKTVLAKYFHVRGNQQMESTGMLFQYLKTALLLAICQKEFLEYVLHLFVGVRDNV